MQNIQLSWDLSRSAVESSDALHLVVMARLKAAADENCRRAPLNLGLVLDKSGSMNGAKLEQCKFAARFLVKHLTAEDMLSVVAFDSDVTVVAPQGPVTAREALESRLASIAAGSSTNLSGGWLEGARMVEAARADGRVNRVLLLTDGEANAGVTETSRLLEMAQNLLARNVQTTCIGFGKGFKEDVLKGIADAGGGNFHFIDGEEETRSIFARELQELLKVAAQNARLRIIPAREVRSVRVLQEFPVQKVEGGIEVALGDLLAGEEKHLLIDLEVARDMVGRRGITELKLSYQQVVGEVTFREMYALVETPESGAATTPVNPVVWREVVLNDAVRAMRQAQEQADKGDLDTAKQTLKRAEHELTTSAHAEEPDYREQRHELDRLTKMLNSYDDYHGHGRKALLYARHGHGHQSSHAKGPVDAKLSPTTRKALAVAQRLLIFTGPGLVLEEGFGLDAEFEGVPLAELQRAPRNDQEARLQWRWILRRQLDVVSQGCLSGHQAVHQLCEAGRFAEVNVVTSSTDGRHGQLGDSAVELYGSIWEGRCEADGTVLSLRAEGNGEAPWVEGLPRCRCGAALRPNVVWPGERTNLAVFDRAEAAVKHSDAVIVAGTSGNTRPVAALLTAARQRKIPVVWIHPHASDNAVPWATVALRSESNFGLQAVAREIMWY